MIDACKYFGCELGAQTQMDPKMARYIVNGAHESIKLQELLDGFIKNFVLCEQCDNPETLLVRRLGLLFFLFTYFLNIMFTVCCQSENQPAVSSVWILPCDTTEAQANNIHPEESPERGGSIIGRQEVSKTVTCFISCFLVPMFLLPCLNLFVYCTAHVLIFLI